MQIELFHFRITKKIKIIRIPIQNHENIENLIVRWQNYENHEIHRIPIQNNENHEKNLGITYQDNENHDCFSNYYITESRKS